MHKSPIFLVLEKMNFYRTNIKAYIHPDVNMPPYYIILYQLSYPGKDDWLTSCIYEYITNQQILQPMCFSRGGGSGVVSQLYNNNKCFICMTIKELQYCKSY